jgi:hypothetical protein
MPKISNEHFRKINLPDILAAVSTIVPYCTCGLKTGLSYMGASYMHFICGVVPSVLDRKSRIEGYQLQLSK